MYITFGIITGGNKNHREEISNFDSGIRINQIIDTIKMQNIQRHEIIVVGGENFYQHIEHVRHVSFDENIKPAWITKKKNIITQLANYDTIVYMHDYYSLDQHWYENVLKFSHENTFDVMMNQIIDLNGKRFHDWTLWPDINVPYFANEKSKIWLPYDVSHMTKFQYISGGYWVANKQLMTLYPLNENLVWGQGEDVEWSLRIRNNTKIKIRMCKEAIVKLIKPRYAYNWSVVEQAGLDQINHLLKNERAIK